MQIVASRAAVPDVEFNLLEVVAELTYAFCDRRIRGELLVGRKGSKAIPQSARVHE